MEQKPLSLEEKVILQLQAKIGQLEGNLAFAKAELQEFHQRNAELLKENVAYKGQSSKPEE